MNAPPPTRKELRTFGLMVGGVFTLLGGLFLWRGRPAGPAFLAIGGILLLLAGIAPGLLKPIRKGWMAFGHAMGFVMTRVILTVLFFLVVTPIGVVMRLFGRDPLERKIDKSRRSYWIIREGGIPNRQFYERQF